VIKDGKTERRAVTVASRRENELILSAGLNAGEIVALNWPAALRDSQTVRIKR
jgi:hypothetical protein